MCRPGGYQGLSCHQPLGLAPLHTGEHKRGVLANWARCFIQHPQRGGWCFRVAWCWEGEAELIRVPLTSSLEIWWALGTTLTPWHVQHWYSQHGTAPSSVPSPASAWGAAALCTKGSPLSPAAGPEVLQEQFPCLCTGTIKIPPAEWGGGGNMTSAAPELLYERVGARKNIHRGLCRQRLTAG